MAENPLKSEIYEDKHFIVNGPYNSGKEIFNTQRFNVKIFKENGSDTAFVIIREKSRQKETKI